MRLPIHYQVAEDLIVTTEEYSNSGNLLDMWFPLALAINSQGLNFVSVFNPTGCCGSDHGPTATKWWKNLPPSFYVVGMPMWRDEEEMKQRWFARGGTRAWGAEEHRKWRKHQSMHSSKRDPEGWGKKMLGDRFYPLQPGNQESVAIQFRALYQGLKVRSAGVPFTVLLVGTHSSGKTTLASSLLGRGWTLYDPTRILKGPGTLTEIQRARNVDERAFYWVRKDHPHPVLKFGMHKDLKTLDKYLKGRYGDGGAAYQKLAWSRGGAAMEAVVKKHFPQSEWGVEWRKFTPSLIEWIQANFPEQDTDLLRKAWLDASS